MAVTAIYDQSKVEIASPQMTTNLLTQIHDVVSKSTAHK